VSGIVTSVVVRVVGGNETGGSLAARSDASVPLDAGAFVVAGVLRFPRPTVTAGWRPRVTSAKAGIKSLPAFTPPAVEETALELAMAPGGPRQGRASAAVDRNYGRSR